MAADVRFRAPRAGDVDAIAPRLRAQDVAECLAAGLDPRAALEASLEGSVTAWTVEIDGAPAALLGVTPEAGALLGGTGVPWMLGTDLVRQHGRSLIRQAGPYIAAMLRVYPVLRNRVHAENTVAVTWLRRTGFELGPAQPFGPNGAPFHTFELTCK